jgi:hypothetical protein
MRPFPVRPVEGGIRLIRIARETFLAHFLSTPAQGDKDSREAWFIMGRQGKRRGNLLTGAAVTRQKS